MAAKELKPLMELTMTFGSKDIHPLQTPHNDALVIQLKVATAMAPEYLWTREVRFISPLYIA